MSKKNKSVAVLYMPVIHAGYLRFISEAKAAGVEEFYLIGDDILEVHDELDYINRKDRLRAIPVYVLQEMLKGIPGVRPLELRADTVAKLPADQVAIMTTREDISEFVVEEYFPEHEVTYSNIAVRRHKNNVGETKEPVAEKTTLTEFQENLWSDVLTEAAKSFDWWRQVGGALVKDGEVIYISHNEHTPEAQLPNIEGDSRSLFKKGININYVTTTHVEIELIGAAAKAGITTKGAELYVTDFPCPYCARAVLAAGITKVYYLEGYAVLDGDDLLRNAGVELIKVTL